MNYGDIKTQVQQYAHRTDLGSVIDGMAATVTERLLARFGEQFNTLDPLVNDADTNLILDKNPRLYLYGMLRETALYTHDAPATQAWDQLYQMEIDRMNITYNGEEWDNTVPAVQSEYEQLVEAANAT